MLTKLFGPDGCHFGWILEGHVFDAHYQPLAFPEGEDLYSFAGNWLGTHDARAVHDRNGGVVAVAAGFPAMRALPSRLGRLPPRIKPVPSPLPVDLRRLDDSEGESNLERWPGLSAAEWLRQA